MQENLCNSCIFFNKELYDRLKKEGVDDVIAGARACQSLGIATDGKRIRKIICSSYKKRGW